MAQKPQGKWHFGGGVILGPVQFHARLMFSTLFEEAAAMRPLETGTIARAFQFGKKVSIRFDSILATESIFFEFDSIQ